jgi:hypothetical protein
MTRSCSSATVLARCLSVLFLAKPATAQTIPPGPGQGLCILLHDNEHMGQAIACARMISIATPWPGQQAPC